jgi:raffinose/stachyose/melibiose transport system permease protein
MLPMVLHKRREGGTSINRRIVKPLLFLAPALLLYVVFVVKPGFQSLYLTFFQWNGISKLKTFTGLANWRTILFNDRYFSWALKNTIVWSAGALTIPVAIGLFLAILLNKDLKGRLAFRGILYFPQVLSTMVVSMVWGWIYHPQLGIINTTLKMLGLGSLARGWLGDSRTALPAIFAIAVWISAGYMMMIFISGLQSIPKEMYEAASIDGAGAPQQFFRITIPLLRETFIILFATTLIGSFKLFDIVFATTQGGPAQSTEVLATWMYHWTYAVHDVGKGAVISWIMVLMVMVIAIPYISYLTKKSVSL